MIPRRSRMAPRIDQVVSPATLPSSVKTLADKAEEIAIFIRVDARNALHAHHQLSQCPIISIGIDTTQTIRAKHITYRVCLRADGLDAVMHAVMTHFPEGQFGRIVALHQKGH